MADAARDDLREKLLACIRRDLAVFEEGGGLLPAALRAIEAEVEKHVPREGDYVGEFRCDACDYYLDEDEPEGCPTLLRLAAMYPELGEENR